jgi:hypothetical protein
MGIRCALARFCVWAFQGAGIKSWSCLCRGKRFLRFPRLARAMPGLRPADAGRAIHPWIAGGDD